MLAMEVDIVALGSLLGVALTAMTALFGGVWKVLSVVWVYLQGKLNPIFDEHRTMVVQINKEMPLVRQTLNALKETQIQQCTAQTSHTEMLERQDKKLSDILDAINEPSTTSHPSV